MDDFPNREAFAPTDLCQDLIGIFIFVKQDCDFGIIPRTFVAELSDLSLHRMHCGVMKCATNLGG